MNTRNQQCSKGFAFLMPGVIALFTTMSHAQVFTEDAGFKSAPDTPILQEWFRVADYEQMSEFTLEHRLYFRFDGKSEFRLTVPTILSQRSSFEGAFGSTESEESAGIGDLKLNYKYSIWQTDEVMESNRWAFLGELSVPTGDHDKSDAGREIPRKLQNGTGTWGLGVGSAYTLIRDRHRFSTEVMYRHWSKHDGFQPGSSIQLNLAYWFRLTPVTFDAKVHQQEVRAVIELLNAYHFDSTMQGRDGSDHGVRSWVAPGIQWFPRPDLLVDFGFQLPVVQNTDDAHGDGRWKAIVGVRFLF